MFKFIKNFFLKTGYVSELDQFLLDFDRKINQSSKSQQQEKKKYARIYKLRDYDTSSRPKKPFWEQF